MVTPATMGWNMVSSSWRPRKYQGALDGFGVWLRLASVEQRGVHEDREDQHERRAGQGGHELDRQQVGPDVDLVLRGGLDVLDRAGLDHGEQALGVAAGAGGDGRRGGGDARRRPGRWRPRCRRAGGLGGRRRRPWRGRPWPARAGARGSCSRPRRRRGRVGRGRGLLGGLGGGRLGAGLFGSLAEVLGDLGHGVSPPTYSGPLMPPSLRTRQKWIAMKMTITNGSISTCSTYQRNRVSVPISAPPSRTKRTWFPNTGV